MWRPNPEVAWFRERYESFWKPMPAAPSWRWAAQRHRHRQAVAVATPAGSSKPVPALAAAARAGRRPRLSADRRAHHAGTGGSEARRGRPVGPQQRGAQEVLPACGPDLDRSGAVDPALTLSRPRRSRAIARSTRLPIRWNRLERQFQSGFRHARREAARTVIATLPRLLESPSDATCARRCRARASWRDLPQQHAHRARPSISYEMTAHACRRARVLVHAPLVWKLASGADAARDEVLGAVGASRSRLDSPCAFLESVASRPLSRSTAWTQPRRAP